MKQLIVGSALMTASYLVYYLLCSLVACLLASYLLISVNKPHSLWSALLTASYLLSVLSTEFIPHTKLSDNLICILPCGLQIWLVGKIQTNQHLESAYYPPQSANLHFTRARLIYQHADLLIFGDDESTRESSVYAKKIVRRLL